MAVFRCSYLQTRLIGTLDMIVTRDVRVMVLADAKRPVIKRAQPEKSYQSEIKVEKLHSDGVEHEDVSVGIGVLQQSASGERARFEIIPDCRSARPRSSTAS